MRVLLSEASSLTARETLSVLGPAGYHLELMSAQTLPLGCFSRYVKHLHPCPASGCDPLGYLDAVADVVAKRQIDVLLPTHEQAWLFAVAHDRLPPVALAVASPAAFDRVESKLAFARLCDQLGLPQPQRKQVSLLSDLEDWPYPYYLKAPFSTAGRGVVLVRNDAERAVALGRVGAAGFPVIAQRVVAGSYAQVAALFTRGRLVAVHSSRQIGVGAGGSAAARESTCDRRAHADIERLGTELGWHGGLTVDYLENGAERAYIECNPRLVEPGNAAASGVNLPSLQIAVSLDHPVTPTPRVGVSGTRTHGAIALAIGAAERSRRRLPILNVLARATVDRTSREVLTPVRSDPLSAIPLAVAVARVLARPASAATMAAAAIGAYSVGPEAITTIRATAGQDGRT